jgi:hypothetical protein
MELNRVYENTLPDKKFRSDYRFCIPAIGLRYAEADFWPRGVDLDSLWGDFDSLLSQTIAKPHHIHLWTIAAHNVK